MMFLKQVSCLLSSYFLKVVLSHYTNEVRKQPTLEPILKNETY